MPSAAAPTLGVGSRRCALLCAALLSCTTVRTPVSRIEPAVLDLQEPAAAPQIELWVESNRPLSPQDEERYRSEARRALEAALAGHAQPQDTLLVVRAQGITRTPGHKGDQAAATA
ncbi:MAG TPA: hypothetical protein VFG59_03920, partial [Anaeromyxobacter sp.]|nr:hypothetical protein [Anaeromyxobacter sp.]